MKKLQLQHAGGGDGKRKASEVNQKRGSGRLKTGEKGSKKKKIKSVKGERKEKRKNFSGMGETIRRISTRSICVRLPQKKGVQKKKRAEE